MGVFDLSTVAKKFRFVAVLEAISWVFLIVGMVCKRLPNPVMWPVQVFGMTHGIIFILFVVTAFVAARRLGWSWRVTALALLSSIPPFCTVLFEVLAARAGLLAELSRPRTADTPATAAAPS